MEHPTMPPPMITTSAELGGDYNGWSFAADLRKELRDYSKEAA